MIPKKRKVTSSWASSSSGSHKAIAVEHQPTSPETLLPSLDQLTSGTNEAMQNGEYDEAISQSSQMIDALLKRAAGLLKLRNAAWNKKAKLTEELQDALQMVEFNPLDVDGYLFSANIYSIQGKQQHAIGILQKALDVVPVTNDRRTFIQQQIDTAKQRLERRIDFIAESPDDIFSNIVRHIDGDTAMKWIEVSHTWRNRLLQSSIPWRIVGSALTPHLLTATSMTYKLLPVISRHVESLNIVGLSPQGTILCIDMTRTQLFPRLRSLYVIYNERALHHPGDLSIYLYNALPYIALTLTTLLIDEPCNTIISLGCILSICRNLVDLQLTVYSIADCHGDGIPISHTTSLTRIHLNSRATVLTNVRQLIQLSPHLQVLELDRYEGDILPVIKDHCPKLISIVINKESFEEIEVHSLTRSELLKPEQAKLQCLALPNVRSAKPLLPHLERGTELLATLFLEPICEESTIDDWQLLSSFPLPKLEYLNISTAHASAAFLECLPAILRRSPNLQYFKLIGAVGNEDNQENVISTATASRIFDAVSDLAYLTMDLVFQHFDLRGTSFMRLLQQYNQENGRILKGLEIKNCKGVTADVLNAIGNIQGLVELLIHGVEEDVTASDVVEFARQIGEMPDLCFLYLTGMKLNDDAAYCLAHSKNSSYLVVNVPSESGITQEGRNMLVGRLQEANFVP